MSALTDLFQSMANKIRSKTGTATTYTPPQMVSDGIDDVFDAGVASATTPITPSNSSPVAMSANTGYKPTASGYAIKEYTNIALQNKNPDLLEEGKFYRPYDNSGTGYAIKSYTSVDPRSTPYPAMQSGGMYYMENGGYAVPGKVLDITPSDSSPVSISIGKFYGPTQSGYAIESQPTSLTPSDTSPAAVTSGSIIRPSSAGYLYRNLFPDFSVPDVAGGSNLGSSTSAAKTITLPTGKTTPTFLIFIQSRYGGDTGANRLVVYDFKRNKGYRHQYSGSAYREESYTSIPTDVFTVSGSSVTIKKMTSDSNTYRLEYLLWGE